MIELTKGMRLTVQTVGGGSFVGVVDHFTHDGNVAVIVPDYSLVRDVFPDGYSLGRAHWSAEHVEEVKDPAWHDMRTAIEVVRGKEGL